MKIQILMLLQEHPLKNILVDIWKQLLGLQQVGINDNFFELGGHSLLATQLVSRIQHQLNIKVALKEIFESPTIESISNLIEEQQKQYNKLEIVSITNSKLSW